MPFKTRRQKISASARRFVISSGKYSFGDAPAKSGVDRPGRFEPQEEVKIEASYNFVKRDLVKILMAAVIVVSVQLLLRLTLL